MALDPSFWLGLLTPLVEPHRHNYSGAGWRQVGQHLSRAKDRRLAQEQQQNSDDYNKARMQLERDKFTYNQQQDAIAQEKARQAAFAAAMQEAGPALQSGAENRVNPALAALRAAGGTVVDDTVGDPAQYAAAVPEAVLPEGGLLSPPAGPGSELMDPWAGEGGELPYGLGESDEPESSPEFRLRAPEIEGATFSEYRPPGGGLLDAELEAPDVEGEVFELSPDTQHTEQFIYGPDGEEVLQYHRGGTYDENVAEIVGALEEAAESYAPEAPVDSEMIRGLAAQAAEAVLGSEGGTPEKAVKYALDKYLDMVKLRISEAGKAARAERAATATTDAAKIQKGAPNDRMAFKSGSDIAHQALQSVKAPETYETAKMLVVTAQELDRQIQTGEVDSSYLAKVIFALAKANDGGKLTDNDVKLAFPPGTYFEQFKNELLEGFGDSILDWEKGIADMIGGNTTVSKQTARRLLNTVMTRVQEKHLLRSKQLKDFQTMHRGMIESGNYGMANGYAARINIIYPKAELQMYRPESFIGGALRPDDPQGQLEERQKYQGTPKRRPAGKENPTLRKQIQEEIDDFAGAAPGTGYGKLQRLLREDNFYNPAQKARALTLLNQYDAAAGFEPFIEGANRFGTDHNAAVRPENLNGQPPRSQPDQGDPAAEALLTEIEGN